MPTMIGSKDIGGGFVRLSFTTNGERLKSGTPLSPDQINGFANKRRLIESGFIAVYPPGGAKEAPAKRFLIHRGGGAYDVIAGVRLNSEALSKDEAEALAAQGH